jgi:hypothetical protein
MPGDKIFLNPIAFPGWGTDGKNKIHHLDNFDTWYTLAEALAPLKGPDGQTLIPYSLSPKGLSADMGVKLTVHTIPTFRNPRAILEPGWIRQEPQVCLGSSTL